MSSDPPCAITLSDGTHYDLSSLGSAKADYEVQVGETSYKLNVCRGVVSELWHIGDQVDEARVGGFVGRQAGDFSIGQFSTNLTLSPSTNEPLLVYQDGSACTHNPSEQASTVIRFVCNPAEFGAGSPRLIATIPAADPDSACHFFFDWHTHVACATNPKAELQRGHLIAFLAIFGIAILTWFGGHTLYNLLYLKRRGLAVLPLPSFSFKLPHLPSRSSGGPSRPTGRSGFLRRMAGRQGYSNIRAEEHDEEEHFAGRYSIDDDDDDEVDEDLTGQGSGAGMDDARVLGGEVNAWRGGASAGNSGGTGQGKGAVDVHQGLVDV